MLARDKIVFAVTEIIGLLLLYTGFKTTGVISVATGVIGLFIIVVSAGYFTRCKKGS